MLLMVLLPDNVNGPVETGLQHVFGTAAPWCHDEVNAECHADAEEQRQRDDVLEIERQVDRGAGAQRDQPCQRQGCQRQQNMGHPAQCERQQCRVRQES